MNAGNIPDDESINGVLIYEMIGYYRETPNTQSFPTGFEIIFPDVTAAVAADDFRGNFLTNVGAESTAEWMETYSAHTATYVPDLKVFDVPSPGTGLAVPDLLRSDHAPYWFQGISAVMLTDGAEFRNPNYHSPNDVSATLNFTFMQQVVQGAVATLAEEAGIRHASSAEVEVDVPVSTQDLIFLNQIEIRYTDGAPFIIAPDEVLPFQIQILNTAGQVITSQFITNTQTLISQQDLAPGVYFIRFSRNKEIRAEKAVFN